MKNILGYYLMPHPPLAVPEVGDNSGIVTTVNACQDIAKEIKLKAPETIVIITPHGVMFRDAIAISNDSSIEGDFGRFRAKKVKINKSIDTALSNEIFLQATINKVPAVKVGKRYLKDFNRDYELDHGALVPLYFIDKEYSNYQIVHITYGLLGKMELYQFGMKIKEAINSLGRKTVIIASGDLSHRLSRDGAYPYSPQGKVFDHQLISFLEQGDVISIFSMKPRLIEEAGECALKSVYIMLGSIDQEFKGRKLSYEGPYGVGYGVMSFYLSDNKESFFPLLMIKEEELKRKKIEYSNDYVKLARLSLEHYYKYNEKFPVPKDISKTLTSRKAGVFVTLKSHGNLRGCIGTFIPNQSSIALEIVENALSAALRDPRFPSVKSIELDDIEISVDVLSPPQPVTKADLDPAVFGVIVSKGYKRGLLLPDLEGVDTVDKQLTIACEKAGIDFNEEYQIERFLVTRYREEE